MSLPRWLEIAIGYPVVVFGSVLLCWWLYLSARGRTFHHLYNAISPVYIIGFGCKVAAFGPDFLRFWVGDFGFPVALAFLFGGEIRRRINTNLHAERLDDLISNYGSRMKLLVVCIILSYAYEGVSGTAVSWLKQANPNARIGVGEFDWIDIAMYTAGGALGLLFLELHRRSLIRLLPAAIQMDTEVRAAYVAARRQRKKHRKKRRK